MAANELLDVATFDLRRVRGVAVFVKEPPELVNSKAVCLDRADRLVPGSQTETPRSSVGFPGVIDHDHMISYALHYRCASVHVKVESGDRPCG